MSDTLHVLYFSDIVILQGTVEMGFGSGGFFSESFIANFLESVPVKEVFLKNPLNI